MQRSAMLVPNLTVGLDLGDRVSRTCEVDALGRIVRCGSVHTTPEGIEQYFGVLPAARVVLEVGTHSPWISRQLQGLGHEVVVSNPGAVYGQRRRKKRNDAMDAEFLARQGRADPALLCPIRHRGVEVQQELALLRARDQLVRTRSALISCVRGSVKAVGGRIGKCSAEAFHRQAPTRIPIELRPALIPLLETIRDLTQRIKGMDQQIEIAIEERYPEALRLQKIRGVGPVTALAFVLLIEDPRRFRKSRDVGAYFGLVPRLDDSSDQRPQLRITKAGDPLGRRLLVNSAQYILGPFGVDCDLQRHGLKIAARGGKNAKKRAAVAVARKLAVLMHRLWIRELQYDPQYQTRAA